MGVWGWLQVPDVSVVEVLAVLAVAGTVVVVVVVVPVSGSVDDRVKEPHPLRINPSSAAMKAVFFIG